MHLVNFYVSVGWTPLEVSSEPFITVDYIDSYVSVYRQVRPNSTNGSRFYYTPALVLAPDQTKVTVNRLSGQSEVTFQVMMWHKKLNGEIRTALQVKCLICLRSDY